MQHGMGMCKKILFLWYTVVAKIIRTLVFSPAKFFLSQLLLSFAVVCQWEISVYISQN